MAEANITRTKSQYSLANSEISVAEGECLIRHYTKRLNDVRVLIDQHQQTRSPFIDPTEVIDQINGTHDNTENLDTNFGHLSANLNRVLLYNQRFESFQILLFWLFIALLVISTATLVFVLWMWISKV